MSGDFKVARSVIGLIEVIGWIAVALGALVVANAIGDRNFQAVATIGGVASLAGLVQIAIVQIARAQIVTAENSGETVELLREIAAGGAAPEMSPAPARVSGSSPKPSGGAGPIVHDRNQVGTPAKRYKGKVIVREPEGFSIDGEGVFQTVIAAERAIDGRL